MWCTWAKSILLNGGCGYEMTPVNFGEKRERTGTRSGTRLTWEERVGHMFSIHSIKKIPKIPTTMNNAPITLQQSAQEFSQYSSVNPGSVQFSSDRRVLSCRR